MDIQYLTLVGGYQETVIITTDAITGWGQLVSSQCQTNVKLNHCGNRTQTKLHVRWCYYLRFHLEVEEVKSQLADTGVHLHLHGTVCLR